MTEKRHHKGVCMLTTLKHISQVYVHTKRELVASVLGASNLSSICGNAGYEWEMVCAEQVT